MNMNVNEATQLAKSAAAAVTVGNPESVADTTVLWLNDDGTYSVTDNGEEVVCRTKDEAIQIIVENLTASYNNE